MSKHERVARLIKIVTFIKAQRNLHRRDLAYKCEVSIRTIQRDIDTLIYAGIPIFWSENGYQIMPDFFMPPVNLSLEEAFHLVLATKAFSENMELLEKAPANFDKTFSKSFKDKLQQRTLESALSKIIARLPDDTRYRLEAILDESLTRSEEPAMARNTSF